MPRGQYDRNAVAQSQRPEMVKDEPALTPRAAQERRERRRRDDGNLDRMGRMALSIPPEVQERLDREGKTARWVRDDARRQAQMHHNDWDVTPDVDPVPEGRESEGKLVLMEKYKDWYDDDQRKKVDVLNERDEAIQRGGSTGPDDARDTRTTYVPEGNRISRKPGL